MLILNDTEGVTQEQDMEIKEPMSFNNQNQLTRKNHRVRSHILAELKKYRWLPFFSTYSGIVLDISASGLKLAFSGEVDVKPHSRYTIRIPLAGLGIEGSEVFESSFEVKWFDQKSYRLGGLFISITQDQKSILDRIIEALKARNHKTKNTTK
ncbi:MAG: PilZ domain-containing protein [Proteobacteria bacterium]|nr:PilZ domain-containing protein [Pseudomonadota bacterium]